MSSSSFLDLQPFSILTAQGNKEEVPLAGGSLWPSRYSDQTVLVCLIQTSSVGGMHFLIVQYRSLGKRDIMSKKGTGPSTSQDNSTLCIPRLKGLPWGLLQSPPIIALSPLFLYKTSTLPPWAQTCTTEVDLVSFQSQRMQKPDSPPASPPPLPSLIL